EPGAEIIYGSKPGVTTPQLLAACKDGTVAKLCHRVRVHVGDTIMVPAGMVHAIGPGIVLYEVQQPSTVTFRLFDWGRVGLNGKPRQLHLDEASFAIRGPAAASDPRQETPLTPGPNPRIRLLKNPYFRIELLLVDIGELVIAERPFITFLTLTAGSGFVLADAGRIEVSAGDTVAIPASVDFCLLPGPRGMRVIRALPGSKLR
ncbi:MAG: class I mannose-6-phosphate isomerase, partial [Planctomycetota bacterium]